MSRHPRPLLLAALALWLLHPVTELPACEKRDQLAEKALTHGELELLWANMADEDVPTAHRAVWRLVAAPRQAVPLLRHYLRPAEIEAPERLAGLIADLDSQEFSVREKATRELEKLGPLAERIVRQTLQGKPSLEVRRRLERLLEKYRTASLTPEIVRGLRAIEVLEQISTPQARQVLLALARGPSPYRLAREARAALQPRPGPSWPMFGGTPQRNMVNAVDKNIPATWSVEKGKTKNIRWCAELGTVSYGGPVIAGGKVFVGTNNENPRNPGIKGDRGILMCFRESNGRFLWQAVDNKLASGRVNDWPEQGIASTPAVDGKRLYYVSNRCELICADTEGFLDGHNDGVQDEKYQSATDADIIWRLDMIGALGVFPHNHATGSPLVVRDLVFVVTGNGVDERHIHLPAPRAPSFLAVEKKTGKVLWQDNSPGNKILHGQWSNPVYAEVDGTPQIIFPGGDGWLRSFEPDTGKLLWKFDCNPKIAVWRLGAAGTRSDFLATPVVYDNKLYIGVGQDPEHDEGVGHFWGIDLVLATRLGPRVPNNDVSPVNDNFDPAAAVNRNSALAWHFGGAVPGNLQAKVGRSYYFGRTLSTAAIHGGLVYAADLGGHLFCLDAQTGRLYWEHDTNAQTWSSPYWVDGKVYIGTDDKMVLVFAHGKQKKLLAENDMEGKIRTSPVAANGVLYIATENRLVAIGRR